MKLARNLQSRFWQRRDDIYAANLDYVLETCPKHIHILKLFSNFLSASRYQHFLVAYRRISADYKRFTALQQLAVVSMKCQ